MRNNEKKFLDLVEKGIFKVYKNGKIYLLMKGHKEWNGKYKKCNPTLIGTKMNVGYMYLSFRYQKKTMCILTHRLIWIFFNGEISENLEINHKNGIKDDNKLSNLELVTHKENIKHAFKNGLNNNFGENNGRCKLKIKDVLKIRKLLKKGIYQKEIAKMFNVSRGCVNSISQRSTWKYI